MQIIDETRKFSDQHLQMLSDFIERDLLSNSFDRDMLYKIVVVDRPYSGYDGAWMHDEKSNPNIRCIILLNVFYVLQFESQDDQLEQFKRVLAHEYGHHWTLSHLIKNHNFNYLQDRLPQTYYQRRGLDNSMCSATYADKSDGYWYRCDKEIIAEDYKFLFAPDRYGKPHRIVEEAKAIIDLDHPNELVGEFIENIDTLQSLL
jgi:hypothetical protein